MYIRFEESSVMEESSQSDTIYYKFASLSRGHFWEKIIKRCDFMLIYEKKNQNILIATNSFGTYKTAVYHMG